MSAGQARKCGDNNASVCVVRVNRIFHCMSPGGASRSSLVCKWKFGKSYSLWKCIRTGWIPARSPRPVYGSPSTVKVVRKKMSMALRAGFFFAAPPLTVLGEPKTCWLGFRAGSSGRSFQQLCFNRSRLGMKLQHPRAVLELIARMKVGIIHRSGLPHFPEDF